MPITPFWRTSDGREFGDEQEALQWEELNQLAAELSRQCGLSPEQAVSTATFLLAAYSLERII